MSNAAGAFSSVLMALPLIAVPCLAVFGLPSIGPATAEAETDESIDLAFHDDLGSAAATPAATPDRAFSPIVDAGQAASTSNAPPFQATRSEQAGIAPTSGHLGAGANLALGLEERPNAPSPAGSPEASLGNASAQPAAAPGMIADGGSTSTPESAAIAATYEQTLAELKQLGVRNVHLANSDVPGMCYFSCALSTQGSNVVRRFEAEAGSPVAAAEDVLGQVQACMASR